MGVQIETIAVVCMFDNGNESSGRSEREERNEDTRNKINNIREQ